VSETIPRNFQKFFRFGTLEDFSLAEPTGIPGPSFMDPHDYTDSKRYMLMPPPRRFTDAPGAG
jgi:hypothetical protein